MTQSAIDLKLYNAARVGDNTTVMQSFRLGGDIHSGNDAPLRWAAAGGHKDTVALLLDLGADIHAMDDDALRWAASMGRTDTAALLINHGADVHAGQDKALRAAAGSCHKAMALLLLRHGAAPQARDEDDGKDAFKGTKLAEWLSENRQEVSEYFRSGKILREQCFSTDEKGTKLHDKVLNACVASQFIPLIAIPLIKSADKSDCQLFQDIWEALPQHWQDQHQNIYMQFVKEGRLAPIVGSYANTTQHTPDSRGRR